MQPVAVVGMACRFPGGGDSPDAFWKLLVEGQDCISPIPRNRWFWENFHHPDPDAPGLTPATQAGFLKDWTYEFDAPFFGVSPREARCMDPQQRLMLEMAYESVEDAGIPLDDLAGSRTGVFVGVATFDFAMHNDRFSTLVHHSTGSSLSITANRISYSMDLRGPSYVVDTACSSSLVALDCACRSLQFDQCSLALVGATNLLIDPCNFVAFSRLHMLSPRNRCRAFDHSADGYVRGEGAAMLVLKPLDLAVRDGNRIHGLILATGLNQDGHSEGLTTPNPEAQRQLLRDIYGGTDWPERLGYVEAHGTGTPVGDPVEARSIGLELAVGRSRPLWMGSVKTNIGHLEAGAGMAGLIKALLMQQHGLIPPHLHFEHPPEGLDLEQLGLAIPLQLQPLAKGSLIGVNSFGFGGTNGHAVIGPPPPTERVCSSRSHHLLVVSGRSPTALRQRLGQIQEVLQQPQSVDLNDLGFTLSRARTHHPYRAFVEGADLDHLRGNFPSEVAVKRQRERPGLVMFFSGQGSQWWGMAHGLIGQEPVFDAVLARCQQKIEELAGWSLREVLQADQEHSLLHDTYYAQPALFAVQVALFELWKSWGLSPEIVMGHSVGEVAAAYAAGIFTLDQAIQVIVERAKSMAAAPMKGAMVAVEASQPELEEWLSDWKELAIGALNGPHQISVSGPAEAIQDFTRFLQERGQSCRTIPVEYAFHSSLVDPAREPLLQALAGLRPSFSQCVMVSTVTGIPVQGPELDANYWWENVRQTVRFAPAVMETVRKDPSRIWLEVSPHPVLAPCVLACAAELGENPPVVASLRRGLEPKSCLAQSLGALFCLGLPLAWSEIYPAGNLLSLPAYPWQRQRYWTPVRDKERCLFTPRKHRLLGTRQHTGVPLWLGHLEVRHHPFLRDHRFEGRPLVSASTYFELALEAASSLYPESNTLVLQSIELEQPLFLDPDQLVGLQTIVEPNEGRFQISCLNEEGDWVLHASGRLEARQGSPPPPPDPSTLVMPERGSDWEIERTRSGLAFGPAYQGLGRTFREGKRALVEVHWPDNEDFVAHPGGLDVCFQAVRATLSYPITLSRVAVFPAGCGEISYYAPPHGLVWCEVVLHDEDGMGGRSDLTIFNSEQVFLVIKNYTCRKPEGGSRKAIPADELLYELGWEEPALGALQGTPPSLPPLIFEGRAGCDPVDQLDALLGLVREQELSQCRLILLTRGAQSLSGDPAPCLDQAPLLGAMRALQLEMPHLHPTMIDLPARPDEDSLAILDSLCTSPPEGEFCLRQGKVWLPRWRRTSMRALDLRLRGPLGPGQVMCASVDRPGMLESILWRRAPRHQPSPGWVWVQVEATGLNFSDVMKAMGLYPGEPFLGSECCGTVLEVGPGVTWPAPGDRVVALCGKGLASHVHVPASLTAPWPAHLDAAQAAALPLVSTTVELCLQELARLQPHEKILIHSATGGVGMAACRRALELGAQVFASAGTAEKRQELRAAGFERVYDSRDEGWADQVLRDTQGQGVEVVLNSLSGRGQALSLRALAPFGRLLELGKTDIYQDGRLGLMPFCKGISFHAFDLQQWMNLRPEKVGQILREIMARSAPLPTRVFPASEVGEAVRLLSSGQHRGKLAITYQEPVTVAPDMRDLLELDEGGTYLVSGGMTGFGASLARWLVSRGARHLVLLSRRGRQSPGAPELLQELEQKGASLLVLAQDVTDPIGWESLGQLPPLRGIFHSACQWSDGIAVSLNRERLEQVYAPKARGAWNLHQLSLQHPIDHFVLFSSVSSVFGAAGQTNYCAANAYLDGLAQYRRQLGLPALVINWGALGQVGYLSHNPEVEEHLRSHGVSPLDPEDALDILGQMMMLQPTQVVVTQTDWNQQLRIPRLSLLAVRTLESTGCSSLSGLTHEQRSAQILEHIQAQACRILRAESLQDGLDRPLRELGFDSLMAVELRNCIDERYGFALPMRELLRGPSILELTEKVANGISDTLPKAPPAELAYLSDDEVTELLEQLVESD